jgi:RNA polymerase sigma factor (TIGR02999 family)
MTEQTEITKQTEAELKLVLSLPFLPLFPFVPSSLFCLSRGALCYIAAAQFSSGGKTMSTQGNGDITVLLSAISQGDQEAANELFVIVYQELRGLAKSYLHQERPDHTLQPTALVHEAYLRLLGGVNLDVRDRAHFFRVAGQTMRRVLVDYARTAGSDKRGGEMQRLPLEDVDQQLWAQPADLIQLDEALTRLETFAPRAGQIVKLRYFVGLSEAEAAAILGVSLSTLKRDWKFARAWLLSRMNGRA